MRSFSPLLTAVLCLLSLMSAFLPLAEAAGTMLMTLVTMRAPFPIRQEAGVAVWPNPLTFRRSLSPYENVTWQGGIIVLYGGEWQRDVWITSDSGVSWELVNGITSAGVSSQYTAQMINDVARTADCQDPVDHGMYLLGGSTASSSSSPRQHSSNVTYSNNVLNWTQHGPQAFYPRQRANCAVNRQQQLFILGGLTVLPSGERSSNDIWMTSTVGGNGGWTMVTSMATWPRREGQNSAFYNSSFLQQEVLYVANGFVGERYNDIWLSTNNGASFTRLNPFAEYNGRMDARLTITAAGILIITAGDCGDSCNNNDVWASLDGGYTWGNCCDGEGCGFTKREDHVQALDSQGRLLLFSGSQQNPSGPDTNDVWRSDISFNTPATVASKCGLKMPTGNAVGLRCIPGGYCPTHPWGRGFYMQPMPTAPWLPRFEGGIARYPKSFSFIDSGGSSRTLAAGALIMYGGRSSYDGSSRTDNDVWATADGVQWYLIGGETLDGHASRYTDQPMSDQGRTADCYDSTGRMYLIAGTAPGNYPTSNVWSSTDAGRSWQFMGMAPFPAREAAACATDSKNQVIVIAGAIEDDDIIEHYLNDVWTSADYGANWIRRTASAPFARRTQADADVFTSRTLSGTGSTVDIIYMANGYGYNPPSNRLNDIWVSSNSGTSWALVTASPPYKGRQDGQLLITATGALLVVAGDTGINDPGNVNDIWASLDGGYTWGNCNNTAGFMSREDHVAILDSRQYLWVMQGEGGNQPPMNDVWKSREAFTDSNIASLCKLKVPSCGVGLRCWPTSTRCLNHCPPAVAPDDPDDGYGEASSTGGGGGSSSSGLSAGWIALIVLLVLLVLAAAFWWYRRTLTTTTSQQGAGELHQRLTADTSDGAQSGSDYRHLELGGSSSSSNGSGSSL